MSESTTYAPEQGDLFEPGFGYRIRLSVFDGPMDLLLYLIRKHRIDIYDIPISLITEQYLLHLEQMRELDIDLAGEFLVMAAELMHIKSLMLLPKPETLDEEAEDPRAELVRRLLEYQAIKSAAVGLAAMDIIDRDVFVHRPHADDLPEPEDAGIADVDLISFLKAFRRVLDRKPVDAHHVEGERYHIKDRMRELATSLQAKQRISFDELFEVEKARSRPWLIITFLSVLELVRLRMLKIVQTDHLGEIHLIPQENLSVDAVENAHIDTFEPAPFGQDVEGAEVSEEDPAAEDQAPPTAHFDEDDDDADDINDAESGDEFDSSEFTGEPEEEDVE